MDMYSQHEENLISILRREKRNIKGYLIGIEIEKIDYSLDLSPTLTSNFENIKAQVLEIINNI